MKIQKLALKGFIGIKKGMGLDDISLDLSHVGGLIAIDGPNGRGKTTVLDNMTPFRTLGSRKRALQHHVFLRDSMRSMIFDYQGDLYTTTVKIDSQTGKQEGFIIRNGEPLVDGKATEYDRCIEDLFGSKDLYYNSVFCAQGSTKINDLTTGQLKSLFSEFLRLHELEQHEQTAKQAANIIHGQIINMTTQVETYEDLIDIETHKAARERVEVERSQAAGQIEIKRSDLLAAERAIEKCRKAVEGNKVIEVEIKSTKASLTDLEKRMFDAAEAYVQRRSKYHEQIKACTETMTFNRAKLSKRISIELAVEEIEKLEKEIAEAERAVEAFSDEEAKIGTRINKRETALVKLREEYTAIENDGEVITLKAKIDGLEQRKSPLELRPDECKIDACGFIKEAVDAQKTLPELKKKLEELKSGIKVRMDAIAKEGQGLKTEVESIKADLKKVLISITQKKKDIADHKEKIAELKPVAAMAADLKMAGEWINKSRLEMTGVRAELVALVKARKKVEAEETAKHKDLTEWLLNREKALDDNAVEGLEAHTKKKENIIKSIELYTRIEVEKRSAMAELDAKIKEDEGRIEQVKSLKAKITGLNSQWRQWSYIKDACSKDGLRALEIDAVAPRVTSYANDLLSETFGPTFSVRFRTQADDGREVLDILVIRDDGTEVLLDDLSGGEKVWNLKALRLAMTLVAKQKYGKPVNTAFSDEEDGALDVESAQNFIHVSGVHATRRV